MLLAGLLLTISFGVVLNVLLKFFAGMQQKYDSSEIHVKDRSLSSFLVCGCWSNTWCSSSKTAYFTLLWICNVKKQLTWMLTAVLLMPGWGFVCKGWKLQPIQMMPSHITVQYLAVLISITFTFPVPWGLRNVHGEKHHCGLYLLHLPPSFPSPSITLQGWQKQILGSVLQELYCRCPLVSAYYVWAGLGEAVAYLF